MNSICTVTSYRVLYVLSFTGIFSENVVIVRPPLVNGQPSVKECKYYKKELSILASQNSPWSTNGQAIVKINLILAVIVVQLNGCFLPIAFLTRVQREGL